MIKRLFNFRNFDLIDLQIASFVCGVFVGIFMIGFVIAHYFIHNIEVIGIMICGFLSLLVYEFKLIKYLAFIDIKEDIKEDIKVEEVEEDKK